MNVLSFEAIPLFRHQKAMDDGIKKSMETRRKNLGRRVVKAIQDHRTLYECKLRANAPQFKDRVASLMVGTSQSAHASWMFDEPLPPWKEVCKEMSDNPVLNRFMQEEVERMSKAMKKKVETWHRTLAWLMFTDGLELDDIYIIDSVHSTKPFRGSLRLQSKYDGKEYKAKVKLDGQYPSVKFSDFNNRYTLGLPRGSPVPMFEIVSVYLPPNLTSIVVSYLNATLEPAIFM